LGYADDVKGYRLWDPTASKVVNNRDVVFAENELQSEERNDNTAKKTITVSIDENLEKMDLSKQNLSTMNKY